MGYATGKKNRDLILKSTIMLNVGFAFRKWNFDFEVHNGNIMLFALFDRWHQMTSEILSGKAFNSVKDYGETPQMKSKQSRCVMKTALR